MNEKINVLYVDDEEHNLVSFRAAFRRDYNILTARSAEEGINIMRKEFAPVVITDQRMPEMTGVQFLEKILLEYPDTVRIILTGFSDMEAIVEAINTGRIFRYITKPWDEKELKMTIENGISYYRLQQKNQNLLKELNDKVLQQEKTLRIFRKYVPDVVVQRVLDAPDITSIYDGESIEVSVLFCDLRNFTEISSSVSPKEVVFFLNCFYSLMSDCVKKYNGIVNQYIGDEIFACFGAPISYPDNQINVVLCALEMMQQLHPINQMFAHKFGKKIEAGIGINTGEVIAGNMGSEDKLSYSITGDTVNTAKRIESLTRDFPNTILMSDNTFQKVQQAINSKKWEPMHVKGKKEALIVYEVLGRS